MWTGGYAALVAASNDCSWAMGLSIPITEEHVLSGSAMSGRCRSR